MTNAKSTLRALICSVLALVLCFSMLIGSTYAWFTDSAVSSGNKIIAGTLDVQLFYHTSETEKTEITKESAPIFGAADSIVAQNNNANTLWEPGKTQTAYFSIKNAGNLDLKYKVEIYVKNPTDHNLIDVLEYAITPDATFGTAGNWVSGNKVVLGVNSAKFNGEDVTDVKLAKGEEHFFALSIHMLEEAGNEYMADSIEFDIRVLAAQVASESDSIGNQYDAFAGYSGTGFAGKLEAGEAGKDIEVTDDQGYNVGSISAPAAALDENATSYSADIKPSEYKPNITVDAGLEKATYEVTFTGLKENNDVPVRVDILVGKNLDPNTVKVYHYDEEISSHYNPNSGYVTFETTSFSPFTIVFDAESEYAPPVVDENTEHPAATVTYMSEYVNTELDWGSYGQWSPTEGLDANLEAAFKFVAPHTENTVYDSPFANWYCDFYVSLDKDLAANQIFLGGNYGSFGWVGFHNGDLTLAANTELGLLSSVTTNPWTYADVACYVGEFTCGVGDVDDALDGATFTVKLRLTNPADEAESYDVNVVTYTFGTGYTIDGQTYYTTSSGIQDAINNGEEYITLGDDIDLSQGGIVIPGN